MPPLTCPKRLILIGLLMACGTPLEDVEEPEPAATTASREALPLVELCGPNEDSEGFFREQLNSTGLTGVHQWLASTLTVPARVRMCATGSPLVQAKEVVWVALQRVTNTGEGTEMLEEWGSKPASGQGYLYTTLNILPQAPDEEPFGLVLAYKIE